jgi:hypothetical protein
MSPVILFRPDEDTATELEAAQRYFRVVTERSACADERIVGRYAVLPFYDALEDDLRSRWCELVNTYAQHQWVADFAYYDTFRGLTPETWTADQFVQAPLA